jgi:NADH dehydrogenase/NADH:ubiquinone oxidoreductase subunit G
MEKKMNLTIDGTPVSGRPGQTILEAAKEHDIYIPTLCYIEDLSPIGACRLCVVEVEGSRTLVGSCHTPIGEGMVIQTHSPKVLDARRIMVELMLASHPDTCLICEKANMCELRRIAADLEVGLPRFHTRKHFYPMEIENPHIIRDMSKCVQCRRCVIGCRDARGRPLFSMAYRGFDSKVVFGCDQSVDEMAECPDCNACIALCPSGALRRPITLGEERAERALIVKG